MAEGIYRYAPLWGEWEIGELIGRGSYGEVYKISKTENGVKQEAAAGAGFSDLFIGQLKKFTDSHSISP